MEILDIMNECNSSALKAVLYAIRNMLNLIQIIAPILLIIMASIHLFNAMNHPDDKKRIKKVINSFIAAAVIFFIPLFINVVMSIVGNATDFSSCWNDAKNPGGNGSYMEIDDSKKTGLYSDPSDYEKGSAKPSPSSSTGTGTDGTNTGTPPAGTPQEGLEGTAQKVGDVVWDPNDVTKISNLTSTQLVAILNAHGGKAKNFIPYASSLINTEQKYSVNVFFLLGVQALESGWVTSKISQSCNNLGGVRESKQNPSNGCGRNAGGWFAYFPTVSDFNEYHGYLLHTKYLTPGGPYYSGKTPYDVVKKYCPGCSSWPGEVISIANSLFKHVKEVL